MAEATTSLEDSKKIENLILDEIDERTHTKTASVNQPFHKSFNLIKPCENFVKLLSARITDYYLVSSCCKGYTLYTIRFNDFSNPMLVTRRYSDFVTLDKTLKKYGYSIPAKLPAKKLFGNLEPSFISQRHHELKVYLDNLLANTSTAQLTLIYSFLGIKAETVLYLRLITAQTASEKAKAIDALFKFLILPLDERDKILSDLMKTYPLSAFSHLSEAVTSGTNEDPNPPFDFRLAHGMVYTALLDSLKFSDSKVTCQVAGIMSYMLNHTENIRSIVLDSKSVHYLVKAIARLLLDGSLQMLELDVKEIPNRRQEFVLQKIRVNDDIQPDSIQSKSFWSIATEFVVTVMNEVPEIMRLYVDDTTCIEKLYRLTLLQNSEVLYPFTAWLLWLSSFEKDAHLILPNAPTNDLMKRLYKNGDDTTKGLCGAVICSLLYREWFDKSMAPRALGSLIKLMESGNVTNKMHPFHLEQLFGNTSLAYFTTLLSAPLESDVKRFLLELVCSFMLSLFKLEKKGNNLDEIATKPQLYNNKTKELEQLLISYSHQFKNSFWHQGIVSDIPNGVNEFYELYRSNFASVYNTKMYDLSVELSKPLFRTMNSSESLDYLCSVNLLFLPWKSQEKDFLFTVNFGPLLGEAGELFTTNLRLNEVDNNHSLLVDQSDKEEQLGYSLCVSREFVQERLSITKVFITATSAHLESLMEQHENDNETSEAGLNLLKTIFASVKTKITCEENIDSLIHVEQAASLKMFDNFSFGADTLLPPVGPPDFTLVNQLDVCGYSKELGRYLKTVDDLVNVVKFVVTYHALCKERLDEMQQAVTKLKEEQDELAKFEFDDLTLFREEFDKNYKDLVELKNTKSQIILQLQEATTLKQRLNDLIKTNNTKISAAKSQIKHVKQRIKEAPEIKQEAHEKIKLLEIQMAELEENITRATNEIITLQKQMIVADNNKQEVSRQIAKVLEFFSLVNQTKDVDTRFILGHLESMGEYKDLVKDIVQNCISDIQNERILDNKTQSKLADAVLTKSQELQRELENMNRDSLQLQINTLNKQLKTNEEEMYAIKAEIGNTRRSSNINVESLNDIQKTQQVLLDSLEASNESHSDQISHVEDDIVEKQEQLKIKTLEYQQDKQKIKSCKNALLESIKKQREIRITTLGRIISMELLARQIC
ncbi:bifunctional Phox homology/PX domain superfamily [Babesia duncani]|uniref:Bifunctional Phox homology/PX domain superfamily n=1 Tax=Babesia duncani TaxID=323732 RepID=A0AAD9PKC8_9APIC|nr:bifunctional Phox homology/PX domain superfamily [Babesia duncani]